MAAELLLYTRRGCCLCEGLEEKLRQLQPPPALTLIDVDSDPQLQARYGLEVPVLLHRTASGDRPLPRVSPRLGAAALAQWLAAQGV